jgi:transcription antitermination factor NusG
MRSKTDFGFWGTFVLWRGGGEVSCFQVGTNESMAGISCGGILLVNYWGLATLRPMCEKIAAENLKSQNFTYYNPQIKVRRISRGTVVLDVAQLFPGYLFVLMTDGFRSLFGTKGISSVVMCGDFPSRMRTEDVENIRSQEIDGFVLLPGKTSSCKFRYGQSVEVSSGPMLTKIGIYQGDRKGDRVRVLFQMLGRSTSAYVRESDLISA